MQPVVGAIAARLKDNAPVLAGWVGSRDPNVPAILVQAGFDTVVLDMQHGAIDFAAAIDSIAFVGLSGKPTIARVPVGDFATASRLLDYGADGIIAPLINSVADARALAAFTKFPPLGGRSWGPRRVLGLSGRDADAYLQAANGLHRTIAMIESREALTALDEILDVPGIDGVFVGPSDLSIALNGGEKVDPHGGAVDEALDHIVARAKTHGKFAGAFCATGARCKQLLARGFALCSISSDEMLLRLATAGELSAAR